MIALPSLAVRLLGLVIVIALVLLAPASAGQVEAERCTYGAISAIGPVGAEGSGDTAPEIVCMTP